MIYSYRAEKKIKPVLFEWIILSCNKSSLNKYNMNTYVKPLLIICTGKDETVLIQFLLKLGLVSFEIFVQSGFFWSYQPTNRYAVRSSCWTYWYNKLESRLSRALIHAICNRTSHTRDQFRHRIGIIHMQTLAIDSQYRLVCYLKWSALGLTLPFSVWFDDGSTGMIISSIIKHFLKSSSDRSLSMALIVV